MFSERDAFQLTDADKTVSAACSACMHGSIGSSASETAGAVAFSSQGEQTWPHGSMHLPEHFAGPP